MRIGYTLMSEQSGPRDLVRYAAEAEDAGFDFEVISDHYFPWLEEQGHSGYAWSMLGAISQVTERVDLMTYVTCPILRYHPAVIAQKAATVQILSGGRFKLGLGAGENLNEHVVGMNWPPVDLRHEMLSEAVQIIQALLAGGYVTWEGDHYRVDSAKIWDLPETPVEIGVAVSGSQSVSLFADQVEHMIAVEPDVELCRAWDEAATTLPGDAVHRKIGQQPVCWGPDKDKAVSVAHEQFRWFGGGWKVNAELPGPAGFAAASQFVRPEDVESAIPCGPDLGPIVEALEKWRDAGFTDVALVQVGDELQSDFVEMAKDELLPQLRASAVSLV